MSWSDVWRQVESNLYILTLTFIWHRIQYRAVHRRNKLRDARLNQLETQVRSLVKQRMFPLKEKIISGYIFGDKPWYYYITGSLHVGVDYKATSGTELYAPFDGIITWQQVGFQAGNIIHFKPHHDEVEMRFCHLSKFVGTTREVKQGELIGYTGNTGALTMSAHLHLDISRPVTDLNKKFPGNFIDPEKYDWALPSTPDTPSQEALVFAKTDPTPERPNGYVQTRVRVEGARVRSRCDRLVDEDIIETLHAEEVQDVMGIVTGVAPQGSDNNKWWMKPNGYVLWTGSTYYDGKI